MDGSLVSLFKDKDLQITQDELEKLKKINYKSKNFDQIISYIEKTLREGINLDLLLSEILNKEVLFRLKIDSGYNECNGIEVIAYLSLLRDYLELLYKIPAWEIHHLPKFPSLIVYPTVLSDRWKVQEGFFVYQLSLYQTEKLYGTQVYLTQKIVPDYTIKIENKSKIIDQLDSIGINQSKLFLDPDSIASYMKRKNKYQISIQKNKNL